MNAAGCLLRTVMRYEVTVTADPTIGYDSACAGEIWNAIGSFFGSEPRQPWYIEEGAQEAEVEVTEEEVAGAEEGCVIDSETESKCAAEPDATEDDASTATPSDPQVN